MSLSMVEYAPFGTLSFMEREMLIVLIIFGNNLDFVQVSLTGRMKMHSYDWRDIFCVHKKIVDKEKILHI